MDDNIIAAIIAVVVDLLYAAFMLYIAYVMVDTFIF